MHAALDVVQLLVLRESAREDVRERGIDREVERLELLEDLVEARERPGGRSAACGSTAAGAVPGTRRSRRVVERLDVLAGAGDGDGVEQLEEVEVEHLEDARRSCAVLGAAASTTR